MGASPKVLVIAGPNGAGKSTLAPILLRDLLGVVDYVNADVIARGLSAFSPETAAFSAGRIMLQQLSQLVRRRSTFAFETTLSTRSYAPWLRQIADQGYARELIFVALRSAELAIERVRQRVRQGGHSVAEDVIRRRYIRGKQNLLRLYAPLLEQWTVVDNSGSEPPILVATGGIGRTASVHDTGLWSAFQSGVDNVSI